MAVCCLSVAALAIAAWLRPSRGSISTRTRAIDPSPAKGAAVSLGSVASDREGAGAFERRSPSRPWVVHGQVKEWSLEPIAHAEVTVRTEAQRQSDDRPMARAETLADGTFTIEAPGEPVWIRATAPGHASREEAIDPWQQESCILLLPPSGAIVGQVVTNDGAPVAGAAVLAVPSDDGPTVAPSRSISDASGHFRIEDVAGRYAVTATWNAARGEASSAQVEGGAEADVGTIVLRTGATMSGRVLTIDGQPIGGATVTLASDGTALPHTTTSGTDGRYVLSGLPRAHAWLSAHARDRGRDGAPADLRSGDLELDLVLQPASSIVVDVRYEAGRPARNAWVYLRPMGAAASGMSPGATVAVTNGDGQASFDDLPAGSYFVRALAGEERSEDAPTEVERGSRATLTLRLTQSAWLEGRVRWRDGAPAASSFVTAVAGSLELRGRTDRTGKFVLGPFPGGTATVRAAASPITGLEEAEDGTEVLELEVNLRAGERAAGLDFVFRRGRVELVGRVIGEDGEPLPHVHVLALGRQTMDLPQRRSPRGMDAITDHIGRFTLGPLSEGQYVLSAESAHGELAAEEVVSTGAPDIVLQARRRELLAAGAPALRR